LANSFADRIVFMKDGKVVKTLPISACRLPI